MRSVSNVAVVGSGISGAVCASILAGKGFCVTIFESGRGPGGRMSTRRELTDDGKDLYFDIGAPYFFMDDNEAMGLVRSWEARGLVVEWKEKFGSFDRSASIFEDFDKDEANKRYVGFPGMSSICKELCSEPGVAAKFGVTVGKMDWIQGRSLWSLTSLHGQHLGHFDAVVASDKNVSSSRFTEVSGSSPPLDSVQSPALSLMRQEIPVRPCFAVMLAFAEPLLSIPVRGFSFRNSDILSWAFCDSSKPGRSGSNSECWVLHSTADYAADIIARTGLKKCSKEILAKVAEDLFQEFQATDSTMPRPFFLKAHRWGSAFPTTSIGGEEKCLWDNDKQLAICGDFCAGPSIRSALVSGIRAAAKLMEA